MLRNSAGPGGESAARAVTRVACRVAHRGRRDRCAHSVCFAELAMGPSLARGSNSCTAASCRTRNLKGIASTLKSEGTFVLAPGRGLIWRIEEPIQTITVITPAGIRQIVNGSEVQRIDAAKVPFIAHFYDMLNGALMGDWTAMRHDFAVETTGDRGAWRTVLTAAAARRSDRGHARVDRQSPAAKWLTASRSIARTAIPSTWRSSIRRFRALH